MLLIYSNLEIRIYYGVLGDQVNWELRYKLQCQLT